jgi:hypothetical protein
MTVGFLLDRELWVLLKSSGERQTGRHGVIELASALPWCHRPGRGGLVGIGWDRRRRRPNMLVKGLPRRKFKTGDKCASYMVG